MYVFVCSQIFFNQIRFLKLFFFKHLYVCKVLHILRPPFTRFYTIMRIYNMIINVWSQFIVVLWEPAFSKTRFPKSRKMILNILLKKRPPFCDFRNTVGKMILGLKLLKSVLDAETDAYTDFIFSFMKILLVSWEIIFF